MSLLRSRLLPRFLTAKVLVSNRSYGNDRVTSLTVTQGVFLAMPRDFDDNEFPLAYLITFRTYGTWLHGDERGSMDRNNNVYGSPKITPNKRFKESDRKQQKHPPVKLDARQRPVVEKAVREVCHHRGYFLQAINARTNHVHTVVSAARAFKAYANRKLRRAKLLSPEVKPWTRHGSTPYLWKERHVLKAIDYVLHGQGDQLFRIDDEDDTSGQ